MHPFRISLTAVRLLCFASWLSTISFFSPIRFRMFAEVETSPTFDIPEFVLEEDGSVVFGELG
jgi:hypothetical protein